MSKTISLCEANEAFARCVREVEAGAEYIITRNSLPVARLVPYEQAPKPIRKPGSMKGKIRIKPGFDDLPEDLAAAFRGERP